jgi:hypothetical protein
LFLVESPLSHNRKGPDVDTKERMRKNLSQGYTSGNVLSKEVDSARKNEEDKLGGSLFDVVEKGMRPFLTPNSRVLELGPGAVLGRVPF